VAAAVAGLASLRYKEEIIAVVEKIRSERQRLYAALCEVPYLQPLPSEANFILCPVHGRDASQLKQALERIGILVRYYSKPGLENCIRISVGRPDQTDRLMAALASLNQEQS
jgi:histidinol-phosphate aminotransferase